MKIENDYLIIEPQDKIRETKIFSSKYPALIGASDFTKPGDAMLEMWGLVPKEPFDPFYTLRGEIAEQRVENAFKNNGAIYKHYGSESSKNKVFDLFTNNKFFGGVYDFVVKNTYVGDKVTDSISNIDIGNLEKIDITLDPGNGYYAVKLSVHAKAVKAEHGAIIGGKIYNVGQINKLYVGYGYYEVSVCELAFK